MCTVELQHIFVGLKRTRDQKSTWRFQRVQLFLCSFLLYMAWIPGKHRRGMCAVGLQHIFAGLKRTRDQKLSSVLTSCQLNLSVEEYVPLSASQHIFAGLMRTRVQKLSSVLTSCQLSLAITG